MEITFSELKQKEVISLSDGKHLGRVCDITFCFPEGAVMGFTVTGGKGFKFTRSDLFLPIKSVVKIGEDAVLVNLGESAPPPPPPQKRPTRPESRPPCPPPCPPPPCPPSRRSFDEYE